jgi:hypothetical protein
MANGHVCAKHNYMGNGECGHCLTEEIDALAAKLDRVRGHDSAKLITTVEALSDSVLFHRMIIIQCLIALNASIKRIPDAERESKLEGHEAAAIEIVTLFLEQNDAQKNLDNLVGDKTERAHALVKPLLDELGRRRNAALDAAKKHTEKLEEENKNIIPMTRTPPSKGKGKGKRK